MLNLFIMESFYILRRIIAAAFFHSLEVLRMCWERKSKIIVFCDTIFLKDFFPPDVPLKSFFCFFLIIFSIHLHKYKTHQNILRQKVEQVTLALST